VTPAALSRREAHAFTIIPNFLLTGILAILVGLSIAAWSMAFLDRPRGSTVFLLLAMALFAVGGGVAQVVFSAVAWAVATRIHRRHDWLRAYPGADLERPVFY
jgi:hypothetical protein